MKKILIITSEFPPLPGGIGNHALHLGLSLQNEGKEVTVITDQRSSKISDDINYDNQLAVEVIRIKRRKIILITYIERLFQAIQFVKNNNELVIICSGKFSLWIGGLLKLLFSAKIIAVIHGSEINAGGKMSKFITKWSLEKINNLIAVSNFTKKLLLENNEKLKVTVVNNGFSINESKPIQHKPEIKGNPSIITIGNVTSRKGQQNVIKCLPLLKENFPEIHYHIVGIPTQKMEFEMLARSLNVLENLTFHNMVSDDKLAGILGKAKVFFMLSDSLKNGDVEGFGIAVLEANSYGLPAIGSIESGIADAIKHNYSGKLVNPHNHEEILIAFQEIMNDYSNYSENAIMWAKQFDWKIVVKKYLEIID